MNEIQLLLKNNIVKARKGLGYSQMKLASLCGVSTSFIGEIEIGRKFPSAKTLQKIANSLHLKPYQLFFTEEDWSTFEKYNVLIEILNKIKVKVTEDIEEIIKSYL